MGAALIPAGCLCPFGARPGGDVGCDLVGVVVEVDGVDAEPVFGGVVAGLRVAAAPRPGGGREGADELGRAGAGGGDRGEGLVEGAGVVVEQPGPGGLVVADDQRVRLGDEDADAMGGGRLRIGAVDDDLVECSTM